MDESKRLRVLYVHTGMSTMVSRDIKLISGFSRLSEYLFISTPKWKLPLSILLQLLSIPWLAQFDVIACRFPGYHSVIPFFFARFFGKKSVAIVGGTSCHYLPHLGYGNLAKSWYGLATRWSFNLAKVIAPNHETLVSHTYIYDDRVPKKQGLKGLYKLKNNPTIKIISNGFDTDVFRVLGQERKRDFLTVSAKIGTIEYELKGIKMLIELARLLPEKTFTICGEWTISVPPLNIPQNVELRDACSTPKLVELYNQHKIYCQLSMAEGFPNALCEAMLCGCVPLVSGVFSLPDLVENQNNLILRKNDVTALRNLALEILKSDTHSMGLKHAKRIRQDYSLDVRLTGLKQVMIA